MKTTRNFLCDNTVGETVQSQTISDDMQTLEKPAS